MTGTESVSQVGVGTDQRGLLGQPDGPGVGVGDIRLQLCRFPEGPGRRAVYRYARRRPLGDRCGRHPAAEHVGHSSGCLGYTLDAAALGQDTMPVGTYQLQLFAGPSLTPVGATAVVHITAPATAGSPSGAGN